MSNIAINGFGRIGRSILRIIIESDSDLNVVAINDLGNYENLSYIFQRSEDAIKARIVKKIIFPDHYKFSKDEIERTKSLFEKHKDFFKKNKTPTTPGSETTAIDFYEKP